MGSRFRLAVLCLLCLVLGPGCAVPEGPELLSVSSAAPGLVEAGGALVVAGRGFPAGRTGTLEFQGVSLVPGRDPEHVTVRFRGQAVSSARLVVNLGDAEITALTGGAPHATFRGRLGVAFEPVQPSAPALRGHLSDVALDVLRSGLERTPSDFAVYLGLGLGPDLSVVSVAPGLEAERVGLRVGDRLHRLDGVRLLTLGDFAPRAHGGTALLEYSRPGYSGHAEVLLARADYFRSDESVIWLAASIALAVLVGLLVASRPPRAAVWLLQTLRPGARGALTAPALGSAWLGVVLRAVIWSTGIVLLVGPRHGYLQLDLPLLAGVSLGALLLSAFLADARRTRQVAFFSGLGGACLSALRLVPVVLGWGLGAMTKGTLSLAELSASKSTAPLGVGLIESPWTLLTASCYLLALVPSGGERSPTAPAMPLGRGLVPRALEELGVGIALALWVLLYGGGIERFASPYWAFGYCFAEFSLVWMLLRLLRVVSGRASCGESWEVLVRPLVLTSLVVAALRLAIERFEFDAAWDTRLRWLPLGCLLSVSVWLVLSALRSLSHHGRRADPWL